MRVLVTGGAGYIGSHICKALAKAGHTPVVFDNLETGKKTAVKWGQMIIGDVRNRRDLANAFGNIKPEAVIHLAGKASASESVQYPADYYNTNVIGTLNVLGILKLYNELQRVDIRGKANPEAFMGFSSSCAIYGEADMASPQKRPKSPYGRSKAMGETMIEDFITAYHTRATVLRYFNVAGADDDLPQFHDDKSTRVIPSAIRAARTGSEFSIFGGSLGTKDGTCIREYIHPTDIARAHVLAIEKLANGGACEEYNLGSGAGTSVLDIVAEVERVSGKTIKTKIEPPKPGDPASARCYTAHTEHNLGWKAEIGLREIVESAWRNW